MIIIGSSHAPFEGFGARTDAQPALLLRMPQPDACVWSTCHRLRANGGDSLLSVELGRGIPRPPWE